MRLLDPVCVAELSFYFPHCHLCTAFPSPIEPFRDAFFRQQYRSLLLLNVQLSFDPIDLKHLPFSIGAEQISLASFCSCALQ
jgi:hypothetical protein